MEAVFLSLFLLVGLPLNLTTIVILKAVPQAKLCADVQLDAE